MSSYFDASALVKLHVREAGSLKALAYWLDDRPSVSSAIVKAEAAAGIANARRDRRLSEKGARRAVADLERTWVALDVVGVTETIADEAALLASEYILSGADAIHLATALAFGDEELVVVTWDRRLAHAAAATGLAVAGVTE